MAVRGSETDGASRTSVHFDLQTSINLVAQAQSMAVVLDTNISRSVFQPSLNESLGLDASAGLEVNLATFAINFVAATPGADVNHIGW